MSKRTETPIYKKPVFYMFLAFIIVVAVCAFIFGGGSGDPAENRDIIETETKKETTEPGTEESGDETDTDENGADTSTVSFLCVGDDLIHQRLIDSGYKDDGSRNYDHVYEHIKSEVQAADLAYCNQETIFINDESQYSGYPTFGTPTEVADAIYDAGFDIISQASNHAFDKGEEGVMDSIGYWREHHPDMVVTGIHDSQEDADAVKTLEKNGIRFAFLNYTYGLNGLELPEEKPYLIDLLDEDKIASDVKKAKEVSDVVVVFLHCGTEYVYEPSDTTYYWVKVLLDNDVDICIASHPHVLEPCGMLTSESGHKMVCFYSIGNMVSTQDERPRLLGGMGRMNIKKITENGESRIEITDISMEPMYTMVQDETKSYGVYMLKDYTDDMLKDHDLYDAEDEPLTQQWIKDLFSEIMNTEIHQPGAADFERAEIR